MYLPIDHADNPEWFQDEKLILDQLGRVWDNDEALGLVPGYRDFVLISCNAHSRRFQAICGQSGRPVALKIWSPQGNPVEARARFRHEIEGSEKLVHPRIVEFLGETLDENQMPVAIWRWMENGSLQDFLARGERPAFISEPHQFLQWLAELCGAVAFAHKLGIYHGDLCPAHVLFDQDRMAKLSGFGPAKSKLPVENGTEENGTAGLRQLDLAGLGNLLAQLYAQRGAQVALIEASAPGQLEMQRILRRSRSTFEFGGYADASAMQQDLLSWLDLAL
jgi:serine/threonine protein kinase